MLRKSKGVTLTILVITIVVMLVIMSITIISADDLLSDADEKRYLSNLYLIKARAATYLDDYLFDGTDKLGDDVAETQIKKVGWTVDESKYTYRKWDIDRLEAEGIDAKNTADDEIFIIQYDLVNEEVDVASNIGIVDKDGNQKYILSNFED